MIGSLSALMLLASAGAAADRVQSFVLEMPVSPETPEGQLRIAQRAAELCGKRYPELRRYTFQGLQKVGGLPALQVEQQMFQVEQEYVCHDSPPLAGDEPAADPNWTPTPADQAQVQQLTMRYFALSANGDPLAVRKLWSAENQALKTESEFSESLLALRRELGAPVSSRIAKLTWYVNPPAAPKPGIYVAADYERVHKVAPLVCGYVMWFRRADGSFELMREETGHLKPTDVNVLQSERRAEFRTLLRCPPEAQ